MVIVRSGKNKWSAECVGLCGGFAALLFLRSNNKMALPEISLSGLFAQKFDGCLVVTIAANGFGLHAVRAF